MRSHAELTLQSRFYYMCPSVLIREYLQHEVLSIFPVLFRLARNGTATNHPLMILTFEGAISSKVLCHYGALSCGECILIGFYNCVFIGIKFPLEGLECWRRIGSIPPKYV